MSLQERNILPHFDVPKIMGILNLSEDSFYSESRINTETALLNQAHLHVLEGATFLDIGALSSRPGAVLIEEKIELKKIEFALKHLTKHFPHIILSVDTFRSNVAQCAIDNGATIINDISGFSFDEKMIETIARNKIAYVLMHLQGDFYSMHKRIPQKNNSQTQNIIERIKEYFSQKIELLQSKNISEIILDIGFGFSKTTEENYQLIKNVSLFTEFKRPILVGISRKSMIYKKLGISPQEALNGTTALNTLAILGGASILRVHDVKPCKEIIDMLAIP